MNINVTGRKTIVKEQFKERAEKKLSKLDRFFDQNLEANIVVTNENGRETVEISISDNGMIYRAERTTDDRSNSLDDVVDVLFKQITKHRTKLSKRMKSHAFDDLPMVADVVEEEESFPIVKKKSFSVRPMDVQEAILRMNLVGHEFFMFLNSQTNEMNVVYRRKDGGYGLLEAVED